MNTFYFKLRKPQLKLLELAIKTKPTPKPTTQHKPTITTIKEHKTNLHFKTIKIQKFSLKDLVFTSKKFPTQFWDL